MQNRFFRKYFKMNKERFAATVLYDCFHIFMNIYLYEAKILQEKTGQKDYRP